MKKTALILGLIAGIVGILSCGILLFIELTTTTMERQYVNITTWVAFVSLILQILGLVYALMVERKPKTAGKIMIIAAVADLISSFFSILGDSPVSFISCFVVFVLFLIAGIMALKEEKIKM